MTVVDGLKGQWPIRWLCQERGTLSKTAKNGRDGLLRVFKQGGERQLKDLQGPFGIGGSTVRLH